MVSFEQLSPGCYNVYSDSFALKGKGFLPLLVNLSVYHNVYSDSVLCPKMKWLSTLIGTFVGTSLKALTYL